MDSLTKLERDVQALETLITSHIEDGIMRDTEMSMRVSMLTTQVAELDTSIKGLLNVWEQARGVLTFTRWLIWVSGSVVAIIAFFKGTKG